MCEITFPKNWAIKRRWEYIKERTSQDKVIFFLKDRDSVTYLIDHRKGFDGQRIRGAEMDILAEKGPKGRWKDANGGISLPVS
jgi:hypothetical protein